MGTDSVDEFMDDTSVLFAEPNGIRNNQSARLNNGSNSNAGAALTHQLEKKLRASKTPASSASFASSSASTSSSSSSKATKSPSSSLVHHNESEIDRASEQHQYHPVPQTSSSSSADASKIALLHPSQLLIPAKTASDQPLIAYDLDSDEEIHFSRTSKPKFPTNREASARLLADDFDVELRSDEDDGDALDLIRPHHAQHPRCVCCKLSCNTMFTDKSNRTRSKHAPAIGTWRQISSKDGRSSWRRHQDVGWMKVSQQQHPRFDSREITAAIGATRSSSHAMWKSEIQLSEEEQKHQID